jgi:hypothetical protein
VGKSGLPYFRSTAKSQEIQGSTEKYVDIWAKSGKTGHFVFSVKVDIS